MIANNPTTGTNNNPNPFEDEEENVAVTTTTTTTMEPSSSYDSNLNLFEPSGSVCAILLNAVRIYQKASCSYVFLGILGAIPAMISNWFLFTKDFESKLEDWINGGITNVTLHNHTTTHHAVDDIIDGNFEPIWDYVVTLKPLHFLWVLLVGILMFLFTLIIRIATVRTTVQVYCDKNNSSKNILLNLSKAIQLVPTMFKLGFMYWSFIWGAILLVGIASLIISFLMWLIVGNGVIKALLLAIYHIGIHCVFIWFMYCCLLWNIVFVVEEKQRDVAVYAPSIGHSSNLIRPFMRSYQLVKQQWWFIFFATLFFNLLMMSIFIINSVVFYHLGGLIAVFVVQTLSIIFFTPLGTIYYVVLYVNARIHNINSSERQGGEDTEFDSTILADDMKLLSTTMNLNDIIHDEEDGGMGGNDLLTTLTFTTTADDNTTTGNNPLGEPLLSNIE